MQNQSILTRGRLRSLMESTDMEAFTKSFLAALEDVNVIERFRLILQPSITEKLDPATRVLQETVKDLQQTVGSLQSSIKRKDEEIEGLRREVIDLKARADDLEQHSRRASIRVFGIPEDTPGTTDQKLLHLCNQAMQLQPPLTLEDIEVSHRVGRIEAASSQPKDGETTTVIKPRPIIVKFVSRRTKARVMADRKNLKRIGKSNRHPDDDNSEDTVFTDGDTTEDLARIYPRPVFVWDDLTKDRARLAFKARELKRQGRIQDTWVHDCSILVKDSVGRISKISQPNDLQKFMR